MECAGNCLRPGGVVLFVNLAEFCGWLHGDTDGAAEEGVEGIDPEDLGLEDCAEVAGDGFGDGVEIERAAEFPLHRGDGVRSDAAGDDEVEVAEVGVDVEGETVGGDEAGDVNADGGKLGIGFCPDAGEAVEAFGGDGEVGRGANEDFFEAADEVDDADVLADRRASLDRTAEGGRPYMVIAKHRLFDARESAEVEDGIADDLAGAVESDVAAAVALEEFDAAPGEEFGRGDDVRGFGVAAESDDRRVFEE